MSKEPETIAVTNNGKTQLPVGGMLIPPGETRILPAHHVPAHLRPVVETEAVPVVNPLLDLLDQSVPVIAKRLTGLADEDLLTLQAAEEAGKTRKSLIEAIDLEILERAAAKEELAQLLGHDIEIITEALPGLGEHELQLCRELETAGENRPEVLSVINAEVAARQAE